LIPYARQQIDSIDIEAVAEVLRSDFLTQGPAVPRFESAVAARVRGKFAVAVNNATSALHLACLALDLRPGDVLWTSPNTFVASANCARYCGAAVDFVDIDPKTWNLSVAALESKLVAAKLAGRLPKIVVPVHFGGQPTEQERIWELACQYGFKVVEDASHSIGATRVSEPVGSCRWSHVTIFSFHAVKIITSGEGGMALTNDPELAARMALLRSHGITRAEESMTRPAAGPWYYEQLQLGFNYRMTDLQAALALSQLARIDEFLAKRRALARRYDAALAGLPLRLPFVAPENQSAFHLYVVRLETDSAAWHREVFEALRSGGIGVNLHYMPVHLQPYYRSLGFRDGDFPESEAHQRQAITLPLFPALSRADQDEVITKLRSLLTNSALN
jgi:UDP-4-amino-4,6-dideoxy-N-acetyl-beta-L-altrosamine transaminase